MSIQFNDTNTYSGLVQLYEKEIGVSRGFISGDTDRLKEFTVQANLAGYELFRIGIKASGRWQLDDSNHTNYPIIRTNIVSGQRDYTFTVDGSGNLISDIYKVAILKSATDTIRQEICPIDINDRSATQELLDDTTTGTPTAYDKLANAIKFNVTPDYSATGGLEIHVSRENSNFTYTDTTKKPGIPHSLTPYYFIKPALVYARQNSLTSLPRLEVEVLKFEGDEDRGLIGKIAEEFSRREKDVRHIMSHKKINYI